MRHDAFLAHAAGCISPALHVSLSVCAGHGTGVSTTASVTKAGIEPLDLDMYSRIRDEGFNHSHVMEYAGVLFDDIGPRLTGSPAMARANEWTRTQLAAMGCADAHLEDWGEFGMAWTQRSCLFESR